MTSKTSIKAYHEAVEEGTITKREREVLAYLADKEATGRNIDHFVADGHKRLSSLERKGLICRVGTTKDEVTGKIVYKWATTYNKQPMLIPYAKKLTRRQLEAKISALEAIVASYDEVMQTAYDKGFAAGSINNGGIVEWIFGGKK